MKRFVHRLVSIQLNSHEKGFLHYHADEGQKKKRKEMAIEIERLVTENQFALHWNIPRTSLCRPKDDQANRPWVLVSNKAYPFHFDPPMYCKETMNEPGNCQYDAVIYSLGLDVTPHQLRQIVAGEVPLFLESNNNTKFIGAQLDDLVEIDLPTFVSEIKKMGWGNQTTLAVMASLFKINICVFRFEDGQISTVYHSGVEDWDSPMLFLHYKQGQHYKACGFLVGDEVVTLCANDEKGMLSKNLLRMYFATRVEKARAEREEIKEKLRKQYPNNEDDFEELLDCFAWKGRKNPVSKACSLLKFVIALRSQAKKVNSPDLETLSLSFKGLFFFARSVQEAPNTFPWRAPSPKKISEALRRRNMAISLIKDHRMEREEAQTKLQWAGWNKNEAFARHKFEKETLESLAQEFPNLALQEVRDALLFAHFEETEARRILTQVSRNTLFVESDQPLELTSHQKICNNER